MSGIKVLIMISLFTFCAVTLVNAQDVKPLQSPMQSGGAPRS
jgi:hypothetical protein